MTLLNYLKHNRSWGFIMLAMLAGIACSAGPASAVIIVDANFDSGTFGDAGLSDFSNVANPTLVAGVGTGATGGLNFGSDGAAVSASRTIDAVTNFSMFGLLNANNNTSNGGLSFGWTKATGEFNPFNGTGTGVSNSDHVIVAVARDAGNTFRLAAVNGAHGSANGGALFGSSAVSLTPGNWYRLEGTVLFDDVTKVFTFNNISLDDFGTAGTSLVTADVLTGTGKTVTAASFGTTGRVLFMTNRDRGFEITDNYFAEAVPVPEPGSVALLGVGAIGLLALRRRFK